METKLRCDYEVVILVIEEFFQFFNCGCGVGSQYLKTGNAKKLKIARVVPSDSFIVLKRIRMEIFQQTLPVFFRFINEP